MERLTSRENALIKEYRKLCGSRKRREETGCFVLEGARLVLDAAESGIPLRTLLVSDDGARYPEAEKLAGMARRCFSIPHELAAYISETEHPQGIFAVGEMPKAEPLTMRAGSYLLLDELAEVLPGEDSVEDAVAQRELMEAINDFLKTKTDRGERQLFLRRYFWGDSIGELTVLFRHSESKVKSQLFRTRQRLRGYLEERGLLG